MSNPSRMQSLITRLRSPLGLAVCLMFCVVSAGIYFASRGRRAIPKNDGLGNPVRPRDRVVSVGGIERPASDISAPKNEELARLDPVEMVKRNQAQGEQNPYATTRPVDPNTNEHTRSVFEALQNDNHPERISPLIDPTPFDLAAYRQNPQAYLSVVEPGRVFQTAAPDGKARQLSAITPPQVTLRQGESIKIRVFGEPDAPVSFTALDLGAFENQLPSITVVSNSRGVAEAAFTAIAGTVNDVQVLAGSPLAVGTVAFVVHVLPHEVSQ